MAEDKQKEVIEDKNSFSYAFKQQVMRAWQPVPTVRSTIFLFGLFSNANLRLTHIHNYYQLGLIFIILGIVLLVYSHKVIESQIRYDDICQNKLKDKTNCTFQITVEQIMESPVFVYYEVENFYQNHRRYVKSRNVEQLQGNIMEQSVIQSDCYPIILNSDIAPVLFSYDGSTKLNPNDVANPCGLIARSFFNDTFGLMIDSNSYFDISSKNIAWPSDKKSKYKRAPNANQVQWKDVEDERFMVWMRTAALSRFRKIWGRIETSINPGTYTVQVKNNYDVAGIDGKKFFVLSTANGFGGRNDGLGIAYLIVGILSFIITIIFIIKNMNTPLPAYQQSLKTQ